jgi:hypothetical protein
MVDTAKLTVQRVVLDIMTVSRSSAAVSIHLRPKVLIVVRRPRIRVSSPGITNWPTERSRRLW